MVKSPNLGILSPFCPGFLDSKSNMMLFLLRSGSAPPGLSGEFGALQSGAHNRHLDGPRVDH